MLGVHRYRDTAKKIFPSIEKEDRQTSIGDIVRRKIFCAFNRLKSAFVAFDLNNDGYISKEEFIIGIKSLLGTEFRIDSNDIDWLFKAFSVECEGYETQRIKYYQFCKLLVNLNNHEEYRLIQPLSKGGGNPYLVYQTSREQSLSSKRDMDMDFYTNKMSKTKAYPRSRGHIYKTSQLQKIDRRTQYIDSGAANDWIPPTSPAELAFPGEGSLQMSSRELNLRGNNTYENVTNFYDDEKEFSDTTFQNTKLNSYEYGEHQEVIPGNEFEIYASKSMPYKGLAYENVNNLYDDEKEFSDTTFQNTKLNSYEYGEHQEVIPGNEFEIYASKSMPYKGLAYENVNNLYDDEKEFSDTTFQNTKLNSYGYGGEHQEVIPGNEFEIYMSESMPYRELAMPDIMVRIATFVFKTTKKLKEIFQSFDLNRDGYIGKDELVLGLESIGISISGEQAQDILYEYGSSRHSHAFASDGSGPSRIKYYQFVNFLTDSKIMLADSGSDRHTAETKP
eukprot:g10657.t1